jgi:hypothetical protein
MSILPGLVSLLILIYIRPHEFVPELRGLNLLYVAFGLCILGILRDVAQRRTHVMKTPALGWVLALTGWCALTLAYRRPDLLDTHLINIVVCATLYVVIAQGVQLPSTFLKVVLTILALGLFVAYVGVDQGTNPFQCVIYTPGDQGGVGYPDGRECSYVDSEGAPRDAVYDCIITGKPSLAYTCERPGLFGTTSIGGRVRYLGVLMDPNDLALATALAVPFAFAFFQIRHTVLRLSLLLVTLLVVGVEIVFTQSRGGQLTFMAVAGVYFIKKYGWMRGFAVGATLAVPILLLGGRSSESADDSTMERLACAAAGIQLLKAFPLTGAGYALFGEHHGQTAHNAYLLAAGELGAVGMWIFAFILYLSIKIPVTAMRLGQPDDPDGGLINAFATAMLAAFAGLAVGIFFLSWTYHYVLWIHIGLSGALYTIVKRRHPTYVCTLSWREMRNIAVGYVAFLVVWGLYVRHKGAWR